MNNENHPSFGHRCPQQYSVRARPNGLSSNGFGCGLSGGHCIPEKSCAQRVEKAEKRKEELAKKYQGFTRDYW